MEEENLKNLYKQRVQSGGSLVGAELVGAELVGASLKNRIAQLKRWEKKHRAEGKLIKAEKDKFYADLYEENLPMEGSSLKGSIASYKRLLDKGVRKNKVLQPLTSEERIKYEQLLAEKGKQLTDEIKSGTYNKSKNVSARLRGTMHETPKNEWLQFLGELRKALNVTGEVPDLSNPDLKEDFAAFYDDWKTGNRSQVINEAAKVLGRPRKQKK